MMIKWRRVKRYNKKSVKGERSEVHSTLALFLLYQLQWIVQNKVPLCFVIYKKIFERAFQM